MKYQSWSIGFVHISITTFKKEIVYLAKELFEQFYVKRYVLYQFFLS